MIWRNWTAAIIGVWFIISPWLLHYSEHMAVMWTSIVLGAIQFITSAWVALQDGWTGWKEWKSWVSLIMGAWFIIQPFVFILNTTETWTSVVLGAVTIALNIWTMAVKDDSSHANSSHHAHA